jgi:hypothetical protein
MLNGRASDTIDPDIVTAFALGALAVGGLIVMTGISPLAPIVGITVGAVPDLLLGSVAQSPGKGLRLLWASLAGGISAAILIVLL